ncbi:unnamed protein product [Caenorhabditis sp. 36 PRJEB53466]|nr:unnamed protein product [Caenorhabditis sp. 36 PRJEB53466]
MEAWDRQWEFVDNTGGQVYYIYNNLLFNCCSKLRTPAQSSNRSTKMTEVLWSRIKTYCLKVIKGMGKVEEDEVVDVWLSYIEKDAVEMTLEEAAETSTFSNWEQGLGIGKEETGDVKAVIVRSGVGKGKCDA